MIKRNKPKIKDKLYFFTFHIPFWCEIKWLLKLLRLPAIWFISMENACHRGNTLCLTCRIINHPIEKLQNRKNSRGSRKFCVFFINVFISSFDWAVVSWIYIVMLSFVLIILATAVSVFYASWLPFDTKRRLIE